MPPPTTFHTYLQCLDQWEYYLLRDSTISTDVFRLLEPFQTNPQIISASDGSVSSSIRAYSWICSLPHGQHLATNHGPVFGHLPSSFRAEAYGLLFYLQFLYRVSQYTQSPQPKQTIVLIHDRPVRKKVAGARIANSSNNKFMMYVLGCTRDRG